MCAGVDDLADEVTSRIVVVSHVWPGITPFNVYDLTLDVWLRFSAAADSWVANRKE